MAWFGDSLPSLSNLKGQITNFTKEVLSDGIVEEIDDRTKQLREANERYVQMQALLDSKDAEISLLRRQNCELEKTVVELKSKDDWNQDKNGEVFFWDSIPLKDHDTKSEHHPLFHGRERSSQTTMKIHGWNTEGKSAQINNSKGNIMEEILDGHQKTELLRVKQDMINRIIQMEEKDQDLERNIKRVQLDEITIINDFRTVISKLNSPEKAYLIESALKALEIENKEKNWDPINSKEQRSNLNEKLEKTTENFNANEKRNEIDFLNNKETELSRKIIQLQEENKNLILSMEELDQQHTESIENLLSLKKEIEERHQCLQSNYEQLYMDYNKAQAKITELESKLVPKKTSVYFTQTETVEYKERDIQTEESNKEDEAYIIQIKSIEQKVKDMLNDHHLKGNEEESVFEVMIKEYDEVKWKKELLEKKIMEVTRELKEVTEVKDDLQLECDHMQANIDNLLCGIQQLKSNLPSIPEGSEERITSLEAEIESLQEEVKRLKEENIILQRNSTDLSCINSVKSRANNEINLENTEKLLEDLENRLIEKIKTLGGNLESIKELKLDLGHLKHELKGFIINENQLKENLVSLTNEKNDLEQKNEDLIKTQAKLINLQEQLNNMKTEKVNLECDISNLREELRNAVNKIDEKELTIQRLEERCEQLEEKNVSALEQLIAVQNETRNETESLNTELFSLREEYEELKQKITLNEKEFNEVQDKLNETERCHALLKDEYINKQKQLEALQLQNNHLHSKMEKVTELQKSLIEKETVIEKLKESIQLKESELNDIYNKTKEVKESQTDIIYHNEITHDSSTDRHKVIEKCHQLENSRDELVKLIQIKHNESLQYHGEIQRLTQLLNEQASQIQDLLMKQDQNRNLLKSKDAALTELQSELEVLQQQYNELKRSNSNDNIGETSTHNQSAELAILREKSNALEAALIQEQSNSRMLQNQLTEALNKKVNSEKELERLRTHLVEIESSYTEEALIAEDMRKELEMKLSQAEEKLKNSSIAYTSANIRANQQIETLQQQMALIVQQRDDIQNKLSASEDKVLAQTTALTNLQIVLERFQAEKETDVKVATEKIQSELNKSHKQQEELLNEISYLKDQLTEAKEYIQAASRLSEQLDIKAERIEQLNQEVERLTELVNVADQKIEEAKESGAEKVDKTLVKNLLLGYLSSSAADKSSVLRVFATILDFTETEKTKAGLNSVSVQNSWLSRFVSDDAKMSTKDQEASLSAAFIRFLESESKPKLQLPALPMSSSSSTRPTHTRQHSTSSTHSTLLLSDVTLPTFPDFVPVRNTGCILKEVLKDS